MSEESPEEKPTHAERVRGRRKKPSLRLPPDSPHDWPKNFNELVEWYSHEVEDITRAAQMRIQEASAFVDDCGNRKISLEDARKRWAEYSDKWPDPFPGGVGWTRGKSDDEINEEKARRRTERLERERSRG
jgi:hypothetical protein